MLFTHVQQNASRFRHNGIQHLFNKLFIFYFTLLVLLLRKDKPIIHDHILNAKRMGLQEGDCCICILNNNVYVVLLVLLFLILKSKTLYIERYILYIRYTSILMVSILFLFPEQ
jgi:hypothetical protein